MSVVADRIPRHLPRIPGFFFGKQRDERWLAESWLAESYFANLPKLSFITIQTHKHVMNTSFLVRIIGQRLGPKSTIMSVHCPTLDESEQLT